MSYQLFEDVAQGSSQWWNLKCGVFTGSEIGPFLTKQGKVADAARLKLICKKLKEKAFGNEPNVDDAIFPSAAIEHGIKYEPIARELYTEVTGNAVEQVGFCLAEGGGFGCSPDGLINDRRGGLEIKCPQAETQIKYLLNGEIPPEYLCQLHGSMAVMDVDYWEFFSIYPKLPYLHLTARRNEFTEALRKGLIDISEQLKEAQDRLSHIYEEQEDN
jgi:hypothetical protein